MERSLSFEADGLRRGRSFEVDDLAVGEVDDGLHRDVQRRVQHLEPLGSRDRRRWRSPGAATSPASVSPASAASQSVRSAATRRRITGAWSNARARSCTIVTTTSVLVRTPGVASRCSAWSLRIASAAIITGSPISRTTFSLSTADRSSTTAVGHVEPLLQRLEQLRGDLGQREQLGWLRKRFDLAVSLIGSRTRP